MYLIIYTSSGYQWATSNYQINFDIKYYLDLEDVFIFDKSDLKDGREGSNTFAMCIKLSSSNDTNWLNKNLRCDKIVSGWKVKPTFQSIER